VSQNISPAELLAALVPVLGRWCDGWYVFGAQAVVIWGRPRLTADVDVTIRLRPEDIASFCGDMTQHGFLLRVEDPDFVARTRVLPFLHAPTQLPLDIVLAGPGIEETFIQRAIPVDIEHVPVQVASPEDLIVMKVLAARPKDIEDVRTVIKEQLTKLDIQYVRNTLGMLEDALGQSDLTPLFESELAAVRGRRR